MNHIFILDALKYIYFDKKNSIRFSGKACVCHLFTQGTEF